jgi:hypothetical protein
VFLHEHIGKSGGVIGRSRCVKLTSLNGKRGKRIEVVWGLSDHTSDHRFTVDLHQQESHSSSDGSVASTGCSESSP